MIECSHYWWTWKLSYELDTPLAVRGRHCCQAGQKTLKLIQGSVLSMLWSACQGGWMLSAGIQLCSSVPVTSFLTSLSPAFDLLPLNQHRCSVSHPLFMISTVSLFLLSGCHPSLPALPASWHCSLSCSCQEQPHPLPGSAAIFLPIRSAPQITSFHSHSTNLYPATILTILWLSSDYSVIKITMEHN